MQPLEIASPDSKLGSTDSLHPKSKRVVLGRALVLCAAASACYVAFAHRPLLGLSADSVDQTDADLRLTTVGKAPKKSFENAGAILAAKMEEELEKDKKGKLVLLGKGVYGRVYGLKDGTKALKVTNGKFGPEELLTQNLPLWPQSVTPRLLRVEKADEYKPSRGYAFTGQVMDRVYGTQLTVHGAASNALLTQGIVEVAADIALALHALHTRIKGYVVLHCDLAPKNILVNVTDPAHGGSAQAVVLDYGLALIHKLKAGETIYDNIFSEFSSWKRCRGTNWKEYSSGVKPFSAVVEWRELGHVLFQLAAQIESMNGEGSVYRALFKGQNSQRNASEAAKQNIDKLTHISGELRNFIRFLILEHESITDEVADVLKHPIFHSLPPNRNPAKVAEQIALYTPSKEFRDYFTGDHRASDQALTPVLPQQFDLHA